MDGTTGGALTRPPQGVAGAVLLLGVVLAGAAPLIPLAVLVSRYEPELLPLFVVPMAVLVAAWRIARDRARDQLTDPLTGLPNRHALLLAAQEAILEHEAEDGYSVGLILLDLDRFRSLNDTLGHAAGDRLLVHIGRRLHRVLRGATGSPRPAADPARATDPPDGAVPGTGFGEPVPGRLEPLGPTGRCPTRGPDGLAPSARWAPPTAAGRPRNYWPTCRPPPSAAAARWWPGWAATSSPCCCPASGGPTPWSGWPKR